MFPNNFTELGPSGWVTGKPGATPTTSNSNASIQSNSDDSLLSGSLKPHSRRSSFNASIGMEGKKLAGQGGVNLLLLWSLCGVNITDFHGCLFQNVKKIICTSD